jgi:hypothetical protein
MTDMNDGPDLHAMRVREEIRAYERRLLTRYLLLAAVVVVVILFVLLQEHLAGIR